MNEEQLLIQFIPTKHCFLQFSNKWLQKINNSNCSCLKLIHPVTKQELRFSWAPQPSHGLNDCAVGINATFAQGLNLHENDLVVISSEETISSLQQVFLTPLSADDYEILEVSRDSLELSLLNQIRVVYANQIISVWVSKTMHLKLTVDQLIPLMSFGRLDPLTELIIENVTSDIASNVLRESAAVHEHKQNPFPPPKVIDKGPSFLELLSEYIPESVLNMIKPSQNIISKPSSPKVDYSSFTSRIHPFPCMEEAVNCCDQIHNEIIHPFNVFACRKTLEKEILWPKGSFITNLLDGEESVTLCRIEAGLQTSSKSKNKEEDENKESKANMVKETVSVIVRLYLIDDSCEVFRERTNTHCVYVSQFLRRILDLEVGLRVKFTSYSPPINELLLEIKLLASEELTEAEANSIREQFTKRLSSRGSVLVNNNCPLPVQLVNGSVISVLVVMTPDELLCWPLTTPELQVCSLTVVTEEEPSSLQELTGLCQATEETYHQSRSVFEQLVEEGRISLEFGLRLTDGDHQIMVQDNILITGRDGSGKSRLAEAICSTVSGPPHHVHVNVLDCRPLKGKKPESIGKIVGLHLEECIYYQPAVLVLENLTCIAGAPTNDMEPSQESHYFLRLAVVLKELLWRVGTTNCVRVIATAQSRAQVHPQLLSARGRHAFTTFLHIPALTKDDRRTLLSELLSTRLPSVDLPELEMLCAKTEGCVARDLYRLADRVIFKACQRQIQSGDVELVISTLDMEAALEGFKPSDLANISLGQQTPYSFQSVGGLQKAKESLTEVIIWPTKYPEVFSQCPLRLERGVLLYGAPGSGKTLLANAVVGESGLNLITVKGPELLSKYIGASEEAVRNVFQKAQGAQPCILFFDEFDSLAPRRGHDSTGVTDRVVNQLLTQMDGVEALEGVWVIAAASRPDLLDLALLRPGRIGTHIHCPLPNKTDRLAILQSLSGRLQLTVDCDLSVIAEQTDGFTGADLQAILVTAQMTAYEDAHQDSDDGLQESMSSVCDVRVSQADLLSALQNTSPSLKPEDKFKFQLIYERFQQSRESFNQGSLQETVQRVTLA